MEGLTEAELAIRAGAAPDLIRRLVSLGIVLADEDGSYQPANISRVRLAEAVEGSGISLEDVSKAISSGELSLSFLDLLFSEPVAHTGQTYQDLCTQYGWTFDFVERVHEALGLPQPLPDQLVREDDAQMFPMAQFALATGMNEAQVCRTLRVYGDNLARIAAAESQFFHTYFEEPLLQTGGSDLHVLQMASQLSPQLRALAGRMINWLYRRYQEHAIYEHVVGHVEDALEEVGITPHRAARPPAMMFLDLAGYTRLTEERGDDAAAELATSLAQLVQRGARRHGGRPVKWLGDGVMFHFPDPGGAVMCALDLVEEAPTAGMPPAHVGVNAGPVIFRDGDYFGRTVNIAARIASYAGPEQVLVSQDVVETSPLDGVAFQDIGPVALKGVAKPVRLHRALRTA